MIKEYVIEYEREGQTWVGYAEGDDHDEALANWQSRRDRHYTANVKRIARLHPDDGHPWHTVYVETSRRLHT